MGPTYPAAGVMATSPATNPDATPRLEGLPCFFHSIPAQASAPIAAATCVLTNASAASELACSAEPALKPNQPNHKSPAPSSVMVRLCGGALRCGQPRRGPSIRANTSA